MATIEQIEELMVSYINGNKDYVCRKLLDDSQLMMAFMSELMDIDPELAKRVQYSLTVRGPSKAD